MRSGFTLDGCERWAMMAGTRWADGSCCPRRASSSSSGVTVEPSAREGMAAMDDRDRRRDEIARATAYRPNVRLHDRRRKQGRPAWTSSSC